MKKTTKLGITALLVLVVIGVYFAVPSQYASFTGTVKINGVNASTNLVVRACVGDSDRSGGSILTYPSQGETWYYVDINGTDGENVTFRVDGLLTNEVGVYNDNPPGEDDIKLNLTINQTTRTIVLQTGWNLISSPLEPKYDDCVEVLE